MQPRQFDDGDSQILTSPPSLVCLLLSRLLAVLLGAAISIPLVSILLSPSTLSILSLHPENQVDVNRNCIFVFGGVLLIPLALSFLLCRFCGCNRSAEQNIDTDDEDSKNHEKEGSCCCPVCLSDVFPVFWLVHCFILCCFVRRVLHFSFVSSLVAAVFIRGIQGLLGVDVDSLSVKSKTTTKYIELFFSSICVFVLSEVIGSPFFRVRVGSVTLPLVGFVCRAVLFLVIVIGVPLLARVVVGSVPMKSASKSTLILKDMTEFVSSLGVSLVLAGSLGLFQHLEEKFWEGYWSLGRVAEECFVVVFSWISVLFLSLVGSPDEYSLSEFVSLFVSECPRLLLSDVDWLLIGILPALQWCTARIAVLGFLSSWMPFVVVLVILLSAIRGAFSDEQRERENGSSLKALLKIGLPNLLAFGTFAILVPSETSSFCYAFVFLGWAFCVMLWAISLLPQWFK